MILHEIKQCGLDYDEMRKRLDDITIDEFVKALDVDGGLEQLQDIIELNIDGKW